MNHNTSKIHSYIFGFLVVSAAFCLALGIMLPILKLTRFYVWTDTFSIISVIWALYKDGEYLLSGILFIFSVCFPFFKIFYLINLKVFPIKDPADKKKALTFINRLGKWSMLDVLVLALTVFYVKSIGLADATSLPGIYFFTAAILLTMMATAQMKRLN